MGRYFVLIFSFICWNYNWITSEINPSNFVMVLADLFYCEKRIFVRLIPNHLLVNWQFFCQLMMYYDQGETFFLILVELICLGCHDFPRSNSTCSMQEVWSNFNDSLVIWSLFEGNGCVLYRWYLSKIDFSAHWLMMWINLLDRCSSYNFLWLCFHVSCISNPKFPSLWCLGADDICFNSCSHDGWAIICFPASSRVQGI